MYAYGTGGMGRLDVHIKCTVDPLMLERKTHHLQVIENCNLPARDISRAVERRQGATMAPRMLGTSSGPHVGVYNGINMPE